MFLRGSVLSGLVAIICALVAAPSSAIVGGTLDETTECVGSLHDLGGGGMVCSGTLIHESWVLTAARCADLGPELFALGADWAVGPRVYVVDHVVVHPSYTGADGVFDFAMMHLSEPVPLEPQCAPLTPAEDTVNAGTQVFHVGYGLTSYPSGATSHRHRAINVVEAMDAISLYFSIAAGGPCIGDSGGPALTMADQRVAGVISATDGTCAEWAIDGRVSVVYETFILPTIVNFSGIFFDGFELGDTSRWSQTH